MNKKQITHWLSVIVIGIMLGFALQFVRAWTEPTQAPPGGNVGAPINTGDTEQTKEGAFYSDVKVGAPMLCIGTDCRDEWPSGGTPTGYCGDGACNNGETNATCCGDCGTCPTTPYCGDGICNGSETCSNCSGDCGGCADPPNPCASCGTCGETKTEGECRACDCSLNSVSTYRCDPGGWTLTSQYSCGCWSCG